MKEKELLLKAYELLSELKDDADFYIGAIELKHIDGEEYGSKVSALVNEIKIFLK